MNILTMVLLAVAVSALLMACYWIFVPQHKESVNIHLDKDTKMNISKDSDGVHIALVGPAGGGGLTEADLFPPVEMEIAPPTPLNREFWMKVARLEFLEPEERQDLSRILHEYGFISQSERDYFSAIPTRHLDENGNVAPSEAADIPAPQAPWEEDNSAISPEDELPPILDDAEPEVDDIDDDEF